MGRRDLRLLRVGQKALRQKLYRKNAESENDRLVSDRKSWMKEVNTVEDRLKKLHHALLQDL